MSSLTLRGLALTYPNGARALEAVDLEIRDGEFLAVLGPSGSGKSSLLRLVAGLEAPTAGSIHMDGRDVTGLEPKDRDVAMVFQGLALYPHMSVRENMAFGLAARRTPADEIERRVRSAGETLGLTSHLNRRPRELSGGERQRVALGRALVRRPRLFLFDEPLSSLDAQLRQELREELARLHRITRTTSIYVTHDQKEALSLGDRVAVMRGGRLCQVASPETVYRSPHDLFVARFVGEPPINLIAGTVEANGGGGLFRATGFYLRLPAPPRRFGNAVLGIRPEAVSIAPPAAAGGPTAEVERVERLGGDALVHVRGPWGAMVVRAAPSAPLPEAGATLTVDPDPARALLFSPEGERL